MDEAYPVSGRPDGATHLAWDQDGTAEDGDAGLAGRSLADRISVTGALLESARMMTELLRYAAPAVHRRTERITALVTRMVARLGLEAPWDFEMAARLSQIGCLALSPKTLEAAIRGDVLTDEDERAFLSHPLVARDLLGDVRRLAGVADMVARQREPFTVPGQPVASDGAPDRVALGGQLLRVAVDADALMEKGLTLDAAVGALMARAGEYNPAVLGALAAEAPRGAVQ